MPNKPEEFKRSIEKKKNRESLITLFLGIGLGILGNITAEYLGYMARLGFKDFLQLPITYHSYGIVGFLAFWYVFYFLLFKIIRR